MRYFFFSIFLLIFACPAYCIETEEPLTIMLDWSINPNHAVLIVGQHYHFFEKHGLKVNLISPADPTDPPKFAAAGKVDLALTYEPHWILQKRQGLSVVWAATLINRPLLAIITNVKIKSLKDLKNQPVAYSMGGADELFFHTILERVGLNLNQVTLVNVHYSTLQALAAGKVMAIADAMRNVEPFILQEKKISYHMFYPEDYGVPQYAELIFVTRPGLLHTKKLESFIAALQESTLYLKQHPEESWQAFVKDYPELNNRMNHQSWLMTVPYFDATPGVFDQKQYKKLKDYIESFK